MIWLRMLGIAVGIVTLGAAGAAWYEADPVTRQTLVDDLGKIGGWLALVGLVPWAGFLVIAHVARMGSNRAGAILVAGFTVLEIAVLLWLMGASGHGKTAWIFITAGALGAAVYNLLVCDWIAEKLE